MIKAQVNESSFEISTSNDSSHEEGNFLVNGDSVSLDITSVDQNRFHILKGNKSFNAEVVSVNKEEKVAIIKINGADYTVDIKDKLDLLLEKLGMDNMASSAAKDVKAPMPGLVIDIMVEAGQEVKKGDPLLILEAMKMENVIKSPADATISAIPVAKGESVEKGKILLNL